MKTLCADLRRSWPRACTSAGGGHCRSHCRLCGAKLCFPKVYTADAAQFCEEMRGSDILDTLKLLLQFSELRQIHSVMLCDSKHRRAHLGSKTHVTRENWICWSLSRIPSLLHLCLSQPYARFGDSVWMQRQIGGLISGAVCIVLLGLAEHQRASMEAEEAKLPGHVKVCTARLRYVDDQIWFSATDGHR